MPRPWHAVTCRVRLSPSVHGCVCIVLHVARWRGGVWELTHVWTGQRCVEHSPGYWGLYSMSYVYTLRYPLLRPQKLLRHTTADRLLAGERVSKSLLTAAHDYQSPTRAV